MNKLLEKLKKRHKEAAEQSFPSTVKICDFTDKLVNWLFPEHTGRLLFDPEKLGGYALALEHDLAALLGEMQLNLKGDATVLATAFMQKTPKIYDMLSEDAEAIYDGDPAATGLYEVIRAYPGFYAIAFYRIAHAFYELGIPLLPRMITEFAHSRTGIDIHPAAIIGPHFCIDHGTGVVIGETSVIGTQVKLYQGVTLGALSVDKEMAKNKRHPTIGDQVVIYAGATILGGETTIGHHSIIGGNVWLIKSVEPHSRIYYNGNDKINFKKEITL